MTSAKRYCEMCRAEILAERIEALPDTRVCVECSRQIGGEYELTGVPENLGRTGGIKRIYGGIRIRKRRRPLLPPQD
jgi:Prokaryotic dksA/traR C4-type zinc finger